MAARDDVAEAQLLRVGDGCSRDNRGGCSSRSPNSNSDANSSSKSIRSAHAIRNSVLFDGKSNKWLKKGMRCRGRPGLLLLGDSWAARAVEGVLLLWLPLLALLSIFLFSLMFGVGAAGAATTAGFPTCNTNCTR